MDIAVLSQWLAAISVIASALVWVGKRVWDAWGRFKDWEKVQQGVCHRLGKLEDKQANRDARIGMNHLTCSESKLLAQKACTDVRDVKAEVIRLEDRLNRAVGQ